MVKSIGLLVIGASQDLMFQLTKDCQWLRRLPRAARYGLGYTGKESGAQFDWDDANARHRPVMPVSRDEAEQCYRNDPLIVEEQYLGGPGW
jgi:hypothetical protein